MSAISIERRVLLFEISRHCSFADCNERVFIGLTKREAFAYVGFECGSCERWTDDSLSKSDIPDWWEEFTAHQGQS